MLDPDGRVPHPISMTTADDGRCAETPMVSVIVPVFNNEATLGYQLEALAGQTYRDTWEVIISDNGSTDRSLEVATAFDGRLPDLRIVGASDRRGASHARNVGASAARADFLLFCDADDVVSSGWIEAMAKAAPDYDMVGGRLEMHLLSKEERTSPWYQRRRDHLPMSLGFLPYAPGGNCGIHASVLEGVAGWSEDWPGSGQDLELSWRVQLASFGLGYVSEAVVHVRQRAGLVATWRQAYRRAHEHPRIYLAFRSQGAKRPRIMAGLRAWAVLLVSVGDVLHRGRRLRWVARAGTRMGHIGGSIKYRVVML